MPSNNFTKEETVIYDDLIAEFNDGSVIAKNVSKITTDGKVMERNGDTIWIDQPRIAVSYTDRDVRNNLKGFTALAVPAILNQEAVVPIPMSARELRDPVQLKKLIRAGMQKIASDVNYSCSNLAAMQGTIFNKRSSAASGFADFGAASSLMDEEGVPKFDRMFGVTSAAYNLMADNLAGRGTVNGKVQTAYENGIIGEDVAGFKAFKIDTGIRKAAAAGGAGITINTLVAGGNYYVPAAYSVATTGERSNIDNRSQVVTVSSTTSCAVGDAFTIATSYAVHHINKQNTGRLKTHRIKRVVDGTHLEIMPPIVSAQGGSLAELQYQNVEIETPSATSAIVFLNTVAGNINPFWHKDAIGIMPGTLTAPQGGVDVMQYTTDSGVQVLITKQYDNLTGLTTVVLNSIWGPVMLSPEMAGVTMFSQS